MLLFSLKEINTTTKYVETYYNGALYKEFLYSRTVESDKIWTIKFNRDIDINTAYDNIYIINTMIPNAIRHNIKIECGKNKNELKITPLEEYIKENGYNLFIEDGIMATNNEYLNIPTKMFFVIKGDDEDFEEVVIR